MRQRDKTIKLEIQKTRRNVSDDIIKRSQIPSMQFSYVGTAIYIYMHVRDIEIIILIIIMYFLKIYIYMIERWNRQSCDFAWSTIGS